MGEPSIGLDFGTTNSSVAIATSSRSADLIHFAGDTSSFRSLLYLEQWRERTRSSVRSFTGPAAIAQYLARPMAEEERPGRLMQSLKSFLPIRTLAGTDVFGRFYSIEELIAKMLTDIRQEVSREIGRPVTRATVGRPVRFVSAETPEDDAYAQARLERALQLAGFEDVSFVPEPIGAAYAYEATLAADELVLIGDFGGGTSDFSLVRVGPEARRLPSEQRLLGTAGVGLAGDALDAKLVRYLVAPTLGSETTLESFGKPLPAVPAWIYANLERWHHLSFLRTRNVEQILSTARLRAENSVRAGAAVRQIDALTTLIDEDLGYSLHEAVQRVKVALSSQTAAEFSFRQSGIVLQVKVTREMFEGWIEPELRMIERTIDSLLEQSGLVFADIDRIFLTGGTSFVPAVRRIFEDRFSHDRIVVGEAFTSVAKGLALHGYELEDKAR